MFHPLMAEWFRRRFAAPTPAQELAWPAIARGEDVLVVAPTGAGKTLAAFAFYLDRLVRDALEAPLPGGVQVLYVSPLKALSNDVQKNLEAPLAEIRALAEELGLAVPDVRTAVRTGDTPPSERQKMTKRPPHVLVTTPESLFILLTSEGGRKALSTVRAVVVDEIHAVLGDKRGAHLALSLARLDDLVARAGGGAPQRIGLSATVRPVETAARFLVGAGRALPAVVAPPPARERDLAIETLTNELGAATTHEQWAELYDRMTALAKGVRTTLVFVGTRRLAERVAFHLGERLGKDAVAAHHGSLAKERRLQAEQRLKAGELRVVVATASLELGIDIGTVDLVCLIGSVRSIGAALQRIGRSGHALAAVSRGRFFPMTRDQLLENAAIVRGARRAVMDSTVMRDAPLDVLAQQIVAIASSDDASEDEVLALVRRAAPYSELTQKVFDEVVAMLSEGFAPRRGRASALLHRDQIGRRLHGRRGARLIALTSGGAIPETGGVDVVLHPDGSKVGSVDEDYAIDSNAGDIFLLGSTSWRILRIESTRVWVEDAKGAPPSVPFWFGEGPTRTRELSEELSELRCDIEERLRKLGKVATARWLEAECATDARGAELLCDYIAEGVAALGAVPCQTTVVAERFFDEAGGTQLVLHAPFGARINRAWGLALRKRFCRSFDFELQAVATDDGVLFSLGPQHSFPLEAVFEMVDPESLDEILTQAALQAPLFGTRFRWNATRALAVLRMRAGKKVPPFKMRMASDDLLAAVFPEQVGCQDNHGGAPLAPPDHPLVNETLRDCLTEWMDLPGLADVLRRLRAGEIATRTVETPEPSVLSHEILNANPYAFLDDAPLEERRTRAVSARRGLSAQIADRLGALDADVIREVVREAQRDVRDADEMHELLCDLVIVPEGFFARGVPLAEGQPLIGAKARDLLADLARAGRAMRVRGAWCATERRAHVEAIWPGARFEPDARPPWNTSSVIQEEALVECIRPWMALFGPTSSGELGAWLGVDPEDVMIAFARIELSGNVMRGRFTANAPTGEGSKELSPELEWCDRVLLARIHRRTVDGLRRAIEPVMPVDLMRFHLVWQHAAQGSQLAGRDGVARVIAQLQGFEVAAAAWESHVLPARVRGYQAAWLDELCFAGEVSWGRLSMRRAQTGPTRATPITLATRRDLPWLLSARAIGGPAATSEAAGGSEEMGPTAEAILVALRARGASFFDDLVSRTKAHPVEVEAALWQLVAAGRVTGDGFSGMRALVDRAAREAMWQVGSFRGPAPLVVSGRWSELSSDGDSQDEAAVIEALARQYLRRWGVVLRDTLSREPQAPPWRDLLRVYRRLELGGEIRGGRFVAGFVGEQFALPEAVDALRAIRKQPVRGDVVRLAACDPLNLTGSLSPGRVPATLGGVVVYRDGLPVDERAQVVSIVA